MIQTFQRVFFCNENTFTAVNMLEPLWLDEYMFIRLNSVYAFLIDTWAILVEISNIRAASTRWNVECNQLEVSVLENLVKLRGLDSCMESSASGVLGVIMQTAFRHMMPEEFVRKVLAALGSKDTAFTNAWFKANQFVKTACWKPNPKKEYEAFVRNNQVPVPIAKAFWVHLMEPFIKLITTSEHMTRIVAFELVAHTAEYRAEILSELRLNDIQA
jgi:hypothetical protein